MEISYTDYVVVGGGVAGLRAAVTLSEGGEVTVLTKDALREGATEYAQGGVAVALNEDDTPAAHRDDTLEAGAGYCNPEAVEVLVHEGPARVEELIAWGAEFDRKGGKLNFTREGAHHRDRVLHAGGDATGREIERTLVARIRGRRRVRRLPHHYTLGLVVEGGRCLGVWLVDQATGRERLLLARAVVLATGGVGQLYRYTSNPAVATGDGIAMAHRAGAALRDLEFIQFHPTALRLDGAPAFLVSEAVRGEGAHLVNERGERFMARYHPEGELAPRDVVARAIYREMEAQGGRPVLLDCRHLGAEFLPRRFPTIFQACLRHGIDMRRQPIPVAPAAHFIMGGVVTDLEGATTLPGLYACGEVACTGVHGANRLASNSLLEGLVFGHRAGRAILEAELPPPLLRDPGFYEPPPPLPGIDYLARQERAREIMWTYAGIHRTAEGLRTADRLLAELELPFDRYPADRLVAETGNALTVSRLIVQAALARRESLGSHYRADTAAERA
ncbi:MAG: L-aspartate oxidase [Nitrospirae bacterium]|nr:MAG: L-aspartate oxidase [Nitrospirota bacterium]